LLLGIECGSSSALATFSFPLASATHMSFVLPDMDPQAFMAVLYSAAMLSLPDL
jgi:hypothetical protein